MNKIENLIFRSDLLEQRDLHLKKSELELSLKVNKSNSIFESLWNGYNILKILKPEHSELVPTDQDTFKKKIEKIENKYSFSIKTLGNENLTEECIADLLTLITSRWNTIQDLKNIWRKQRNEFGSKQIEKIKELEKIQTKPENTLIESDRIVNSLFENLAEQERLLSVEEKATEEQYEIQKIKDQILNIASEQFKK